MIKFIINKLLINLIKYKRKSFYLFFIIFNNLTAPKSNSSLSARGIDIKKNCVFSGRPIIFNSPIYCNGVKSFSEIWHSTVLELFIFFLNINLLKNSIFLILYR